MAFQELIARLGMDVGPFQTGLGTALAGADKLGQKFSGLTKDLAKSSQDLGKSIGDMGQKLSSFGSSATMAISAPLAGLAALAVATSDKMATAKIGFETMLGSAQKADAFIRELADFAKRTPFDFPGLQSAAQRMLALGFASKEIVPLLTAVGNAVGQLGGGQEKIDRIVLAFGQMQAKGRVMTQEMNQLTEQGVKAWTYLADAIGKAQGRVVSVGEVMKMAEKGMLDGASAVRVIALAMEKDFAGGMEKVSKLVTGQLSNLRDAILGPNGPLEQLGKALTPMVLEWIKSLQSLIPIINSVIAEFRSFSPETQRLIVNLGAMAVAIGPLTFGLGQLAKVFGPLTTGFGLLLESARNAAAFNWGWLTTGEAAMKSMAVAVAATAAAFAGWQLGKWAYEQIPGVKALAEFLFGWLDPFTQSMAKVFSGQTTTAEFTRTVLALETGLKTVGVTVDRGTMSMEEYSKALRRAAVSAGLMKQDLSLVAKDLTNLLKFEFTGDVLAKGTNESLEQWVARLKQAAVSVGLLGEETKKAAPKVDLLGGSLLKLGEAKIPAWQKQINDGWKEWDAAIENLRGRVRGLLEAFEETDIPREFLGPLADQLERLGEDDLKKLGASIQQLMAQEQAIEDGWADWARETENLRGKIRGLAEEFRELDIPAEFAAGLESISTLSEDALQGLEPVLSRLIEQQKAINDGWADWDAADAKLEASIRSMQAALEEFGVTMDRTAGETLESFATRVDAELTAQQQIADGWKELGEAEARESAKVSEVWRRFQQDISSTMDRLGNDIARNITSLKGIGDAFKEWALSIKDAILNLVINQALKPLTDYITNVAAPAIANFVTRSLGFATTAAGGAAASAAGGAGQAAGAVGSAVGGVVSGFSGGLAGAVTAISSAVNAITGIMDLAKQYNMERDIARIEVTSRGQLAEALNLRADLWDQHGKLLSTLDSLAQFTWVKLDEIITSIRTWAGGGGAGPTGSTTYPGTPNSFAGGAGQPPRIREEGPAHLPGLPPLSSALPGSITTSNVPFGNPFPEPVEWEESVQGLIAAGEQLSSAAGVLVRVGDVIVRGMLPEAVIPNVPGGHDGAGVGSATAAYQAYYRALEEATFGPRQRGTQGSPFGGGRGVTLPPGVTPYAPTFNIYIQGDLATEAQRRLVARELAQYVDDYRTAVRQI